MIKWIVFDIFSTLVEKDKAFGLTSFNKIVGAKVSREQFTRGFEEAVCTRNFKNNKEAAITLCDYFNLPCDEEKINKMKVFREKGFKKVKLYSGYSKLLPLLKKKGFKLGILSNTTHTEIEPIEKIYGKYFDKLIYSSDVGMLKPFPSIYDYLVRHLKVKPNEILFVDDVEGNLVIPRKLGFKTFHFKESVKQLALFLEEEKLI